MTGTGPGQQGTLYLLHFSEPYKHARHYQHFTSDLPARLAEHDAGRGARLLAVARAAGITWTLARTWPGDRKRERQLKAQGGASRRCPECGITPRTTPAAERKEQAAMKQPPDRDVNHPQGTRPPKYVIVTWVSEQLLDRVQRNSAALAQDRQDPGKKAPGRRAEPEAEREAEP